MDDYTYKYIILEILEKVYRLKNYIAQNNLQHYNNSNDDIIKIFNHTIENILNQIGQIIEKIDNASIDEYFVIQRKLANVYESITCLHENLKYLHTDWLKPEIFTFVNQLRTYIPKSDEFGRINIILSDEYTFLETNLSNKFLSCISNFSPYSIQEMKDKNPTVILPKIEFCNPLNWPILTHELAHIDEEHIKKFIDSPELYPPDISVADKLILRAWAEEIYCDLFASNLLGPCYYLSLTSFALLNSLSTGIGVSSKTHPPFAMRMAILYSFLDHSKLHIQVKDHEMIDTLIHQHYYKMLDVVDETILKFPAAKQSERKIDGLNIFYDYIKENFEAVNHIPAAVKSSQLESMELLVEKLKNNIPIGSLRDYSEDDEFLKRLEGELSLEDFNKIKNSLTERKTEIWEILNAGWLYKFNTLIPRGMDLFFSENNETIDKKLKIYGKYLEILDDRLLISIESSTLMDYIEN